MDSTLMDSSTQVFICYRREDSAGHAGRIFDRLESEYGKERIFIDVSGMPVGEDFKKHLENCINQSAIFLAIIGRYWLSAVDASTGQRRIDMDDDPVRQEVLLALEKDTLIIPLIVHGAAMPAKEALPGPIQELALRHALTLYDDDWSPGIEKLLAAIQGRFDEIATLRSHQTIKSVIDVRRLEEGAENWNSWRRERPSELPDLSGNDLRRFDFVNFNMRQALIIESDLRNAFFRGNDLTDCNFSNSALDGVDFQGADLTRTNLTGASIAGANLKGAIFSSTLLGALDLSRINLSCCTHHSPSIIGVDVLKLTAQGLVENWSNRDAVVSFLRGCGIYEEALELFDRLAAPAIKFYSAFIAYSQQDRIFARRLHSALQARGVRCWLDEHDMRAGDRILDVVNDAIRLHDKILLCSSESSLTSWWVKDEISKAMERERQDGRDIIVPLDLDGYLLNRWEDGLAPAIRSRLAADFTGWETDNAKFEEQFERVVRALRTDDRVREKAPESKL